MEANDERLDKYTRRYSYFAPVIAAIALLLVIGVYIYQFDLPLGDTDKFGTFGDYFGGTLNPIFGFLTFIGLLLTIWLQQKSLEVQRKELNASTQELAKSTKALEIQNATMLTQNFEGTFFKMLDRHTQLLQNFKVDDVSGVMAIEKMFRLMDLVRYDAASPKEAYEVMYGVHEQVLGPYFRNLYHTVKLIDENKCLKSNEKYKYANILRAQLSSYEVALIFYNCVSSVGQGFHSLVVKYRFLKHMDASLLIKSEWAENKNFYPEKAYQARN